MNTNNSVPIVPPNDIVEQVLSNPNFDEELNSAFNSALILLNEKEYEKYWLIIKKYIQLETKIKEGVSAFLTKKIGNKALNNVKQEKYIETLSLLHEFRFNLITFHSEHIITLYKKIFHSKNIDSQEEASLIKGAQKSTVYVINQLKSFLSKNKDISNQIYLETIDALQASKNIGEEYIKNPKLI